MTQIGSQDGLSQELDQGRMWVMYTILARRYLLDMSKTDTHI
jgi:hypothetical protein